MRNIVVIGVVLALIGCGGFDDMDAKRDTIGGNSSSNPSNPSNPDIKSNWQYSSFASDGRTTALKANNFSTNYFFDPKDSNKKNSPWIELEKRLSSDKVVTETVTIFVHSTVSCMPSCNVNIKFDNKLETYQMSNSIDGVIIPRDTNTEKALFREFSTSNNATVSIPVIGLLKPFDADYDLRNYDAENMDFVNF